MINYKFNKYLNLDLRLMQLLEPYAYRDSNGLGMTQSYYNKRIDELLKAQNTILQNATNAASDIYNVGNMSRRDMRRFRKDMGWNKGQMRNFIRLSADGTFDDKELAAVNSGQGISRSAYRLARNNYSMTGYDIGSKYGFRNNAGVLNFIKDLMHSNEKIGRKFYTDYQNASKDIADFKTRWQPIVNNQVNTLLKSFADIIANKNATWDDIIKASDYGDVKNMLRSLYAGDLGKDGFTDDMAKATYNHFISNDNGFRDMREGTRGFGVNKDGKYTYNGTEGLFVFTPGSDNSGGTWANDNYKPITLKRGNDGDNINYFVRGWNHYQQGGQMLSQDLQEQLAEMICRAAFVKIAEAAANQLQIAPKQAVEAVLKEAQSNPQKLQETLSSKEILQQAELFIALNAPLMIEVVKEKGWKGLYLAIMTLKAKQGTKLSYINSLKGICPEGYEMSYMKAGGKVCPVCKKKVKINKDCGGNAMKMHATGGISEMMNQIKTDLLACGGKMKKVKKDLDGGKAFSDKEMSDYGKLYYMAERKTNYPNASQALLEGKEPITVWRKDKNGKKFKFTGIFKNNSSNPFDLHPYTK